MCSGKALAQRALLGQLSGVSLVLEHAELVAGNRNAAQAQDLNRIGRSGRIHVGAARIYQGANATIGRSGHQRVAWLERAALDEDGSHRTAALVKVRLDNETGRKRVGVGAQLQHIGLKQDGFQQVVDMKALFTDTSTNMLVPPHSSGTTS